MVPTEMVGLRLPLYMLAWGDHNGPTAPVIVDLGDGDGLIIDDSRQESEASHQELRAHLPSHLVGRGVGVIKVKLPRNFARMRRDAEQFGIRGFYVQVSRHNPGFVRWDQARITCIGRG